MSTGALLFWRLMIYIGIDPGKSTGFAIWDGKKITRMGTTDFWGVVEVVKSCVDNGDEVEVVLEDPSQNKPVFSRDLRGSRQQVAKKMQRIGQNVGMNKKEALLLAEYLQKEGIACRRVQPTKSKWSAKDLKTYTGITKRTNEHVRDAIRLVYGR